MVHLQMSHVVGRNISQKSAINEEIAAENDISWSKMTIFSLLDILGI